MAGISSPRDGRAGPCFRDPKWQGDAGGWGKLWGGQESLFRVLQRKGSPAPAADLADGVEQSAPQVGSCIGPCRRPPRADLTPARRAGDGSGSALGRCLRRLRRSHGSAPDRPDEARRQQERLQPVRRAPCNPREPPLQTLPPERRNGVSSGSERPRSPPQGNRQQVAQQPNRRAAARTRAAWAPRSRPSTRRFAALSPPHG